MRERGAPRSRFRRILLKLSGEGLQAGDKTISPDVLNAISAEVADAQSLDIQVALVIGGGNIFRGMSTAGKGMDRVSADSMGMLATVINALALQDALEKNGLDTRVQSAIEMNRLCEPYIRRRAVRHLEKGRVVIFAAGTGNPYFTTDTAASLRAMEIGADAILKATQVDGVYERDPHKDPTARRYSQVSYLDAINMGLKVMDATAISLCMDNDLPIIVFRASDRGALKRLMLGEDIGTQVTNCTTKLRDTGT